MDRHFPYHEIAPLLGQARIMVGGQEVKGNSLRLRTFITYGPTCYMCGITGTYFKLTLNQGGNAGSRAYHINLYATDAAGVEVLMTQDHVIPLSQGGKDHISNTRTACYTCNFNKGTGAATPGKAPPAAPARPFKEDRPHKAAPKRFGRALRKLLDEERGSVGPRYAKQLVEDGLAEDLGPVDHGNRLLKLTPNGIEAAQRAKGGDNPYQVDGKLKSAAEVLDRLAEQGLVTRPSKPPIPYTDAERARRKELADILGQASDQPASQLIIADRD